MLKPVSTRRHPWLPAHACLGVVLGLALLLTMMIAPLEASKEYPTINELMESGEITKDLSDEPELPPPPPDFAAPKVDEDGEPIVPTALTTEEQAPIEPAEPTPAVASVALTSVPVVPLAQKVVRIGRVPFMNVKRMLAHYQPLIAFLKQEMGVKDVQVVTAKDYSGVQNALARGSIDFAWFGPTAYVIGSEKVPMTPLVQAKRRTGASYRGVFLTRKDSGILGIEDIKGKTIGFVDPESASGYLYPLYFLHQSKLNPHTACRKVEFLQKHDAVLVAVLEKKIDVGVCLEDTFLSVKDPKFRDQLLVLGKTLEVPSDVVACREDCDPILRDAFKKALLKIASLKQAIDPATGQPPILEFLPIDEDNIDKARGVLKAIKSLRRR